MPSAEMAVRISEAVRKPAAPKPFSRAVAKAAEARAAIEDEQKVKERVKAKAKPAALAPLSSQQVRMVGVLPQTTIATARTTQVAPILPTLPTAFSSGLSSRIQGVDLRLDNFDVATPKQVTTEDYTAAPLEKCTAIGDFFWSCLEAGQGFFKDDDRILLSEVFNPALSDRHQEGDLFSPPDVSHSYITKLRSLVKEEEMVRLRRKEVFLSKLFVVGDPGPLFPSSWTPAFEVARGRTPIRVQDGQPNGVLELRPEYCKGVVSAVLARVLHVSVPVFDRTTEEGMRFRIFKIGSLEIRTTQELLGDEIIGAVFSVRSRSSGTQEHREKQVHIQGEDSFIKVTEYVEAAFENDASDFLECQYYIVLETQSGRRVLTERLRDGRVTWEEDPDDLEDRCSLAKVTRTLSCSDTAVSADAILRYRSSAAEDSADDRSYTSPEVCRRYASETWETFSRYVEQQQKVVLPPLHELVRELRETIHLQQQEQLQTEARAPKDDSDLVD
jgi:hypothetical protein